MRYSVLFEDNVVSNMASRATGLVNKAGTALSQVDMKGIASKAGDYVHKAGTALSQANKHDVLTASAYGAGAIGTGYALNKFRKHLRDGRTGMQPGQIEEE